MVHLVTALTGCQERVASAQQPVTQRHDISKFTGEVFYAGDRFAGDGHAEHFGGQGFAHSQAGDVAQRLRNQPEQAAVRAVILDATLVLQRPQRDHRVAVA